MRARFGIEQRLNFYPAEDLELIVRRTADVLKVEIDDGGRDARSRAARAARRASRTACCAACATTRRCSGNGVITQDVADAGARAARRRPVRARRHGRAHPQDDHREVRRRPGRPEHDRGRDRRGREHDRGSVRAVPRAARLPAAHAARPMATRSAYRHFGFTVAGWTGDRCSRSNARTARSPASRGRRASRIRKRARPRCKSFSGSFQQECGNRRVKLE